MQNLWYFFESKSNVTESYIMRVKLDLDHVFMMMRRMIRLHVTRALDHMTSISNRKDQGPILHHKNKSITFIFVKHLQI